MSDSELLQSVLDEIPIEFRERFEAVARGPVEAHDALRRQIDGYTSMVRQVAAWVTSLDPDVADRIAATCHGLLDRFEGGPKGSIAGATAVYFVEEDEDDEITGVLGFDDDIQVVNAVCRVLGADDLLLPLIR
ncbi:MAG: hypothetical protein H6737_30685 [Alphaproteobacteria bacterium]|nr:hypothetical protein [Alphaproteobacteria bacterium]